MSKTLLLAATLLVSLPAAAQTASEQLQKAIFAQDSQGNLEGAITIYRQLAYSGLTPQDVAAEAQYRMAQALLGKGDVTAATREFERLERDFADYQKLVASLATARHAPAPAGAVGSVFPREAEGLLIEARTSRFDAGIPVSFRGKITAVVWTNPRSVMMVDAGNQKYGVQLTTPQALVQQGLSRTTFTVGQEVVIQG